MKDVPTEATPAASAPDRAAIGQPAEAGPEPATAAARLWDWAGRHPAVVLTAVCLACLGPFTYKAFHIDDPLFLWAGQQIQKHPLDPYGFRVLWYFEEMPMHEVTKNPPLACYYLAAAAWVTGGWHEIPLHLAFLVWPLGVAWGTYRLAQRFCSRPLLAAVATLVAPVMLVSATNVMCDVMMLCLWVWAVVWWDRGLETGRWPALVLAGLLVGLSALAKYYGMSLIPLLLVYGLARQRRPGWWILALLIPVAILAAYQEATLQLYGRGLLSDAAGYASQLREEIQEQFRPMRRLRPGLLYAGGCIAFPLFFVPVLWTRRQVLPGLFILVVGFIILADLILMFAPWWQAWLHNLTEYRTVHAMLFGAAAVLLLLIAVLDVRKNRDAGSVLLVLWLVGTLIFATFVNWTINGRSILPAVPAAAILLARQLDRRWGPAPAGPRWWLALPLVPTAALGLAVTWGDYKLADSERWAAREIRAKYGQPPGVLWFQGHWGFQYYMQQPDDRFGPPARALDFRFKPDLAGGRTLDATESGLLAGDRLVVPSNNTYLVGGPIGQSKNIDILTVRACRWAATMSRWMRAGFYADNYAGMSPLPYVFGKVPPEIYSVLVIGPPGWSVLVQSSPPAPPPGVSAGCYRPGAADRSAGSSTSDDGLGTGGQAIDRGVPGRGWPVSATVTRMACCLPSRTRAGSQ